MVTKDYLNSLYISQQNQIIVFFRSKEAQIKLMFKKYYKKKIIIYSKQIKLNHTRLFTIKFIDNLYLSSSILQ